MLRARVWVTLLSMVPPNSGCGWATSARPRGVGNCSASGRSSAHWSAPAAPASVKYSVCGFIGYRQRSDFEALDDLSADDMRIDDFVDVVVVDIGVPGALRINH